MENVRVMESHRYAPLTDPESIRILSIHPGDIDAAQIRCSMKIRVLSDDSPRFEALSYTWGDASDCVGISIAQDDNWTEVLVTRNCYNALRSLRYKDSPRDMWIDAICINQCNMAERTDQVRMMDRIYSVAQRTIIYLGEHSASSRVLFDELSQADNIFDHQIGPGKHSIRPRANEGTETDEEEAAALDELLDRPWFGRVWILQEVLEGRNIKVMCGRESASCKALTACAYGWDNETRVTENPVPFSFQLFEDDVAEIIRGPTYDTECHWACRLWVLLRMTRHCGASDPRDKIFALKSLVQYKGNDDAKSEFCALIDYAKSVEDVYQEVGLILLSHVCLLILQASRHPHNLKMPSWIPDWSYQSTVTDGLQWTDVGQDLDWWGFLQLPMLQTPMVKNKLFSVNMVPCQETLCSSPHSLHHVLNIWGSRCGRIVDIGAPLNFDTMEDWDDQITTMYMTIWDILDETKDLDQMATELLTLKFLETFHDIVSAPFYEDSGSNHALKFFARGVPFHERVAERGEFDMYSSLSNCRIFVEETGCVGIAPSGACLGDTVVLIPFAPCPCILRKGPKESWKLISGDCHLMFTEDYGGGLSSDSAYQNGTHICLRGMLEEFEIW